jgi:hypothetical protein
MFGESMPFRLVPHGEPHMYRTFMAHTPRERKRKAGCVEYGCVAMRKGWATAVDESTELGMMQALYIRKSSGREFTEERGGDGLTTFRFKAGQECFARDRHLVDDGPPLLGIANGDWRAADRPVVVGESEWTGRLGDSVLAIAERREKG